MNEKAVQMQSPTSSLVFYTPQFPLQRLDQSLEDADYNKDLQGTNIFFHDKAKLKAPVLCKEYKLHVSFLGASFSCNQCKSGFFQTLEPFCKMGSISSSQAPLLLNLCGHWSLKQASCFIGQLSGATYPVQKPQEDQFSFMRSVETVLLPVR